MSDRNIISVFSLVMPYNLSLWFRLPTLDMFRELQLILEIVMLGNSSIFILHSDGEIKTGTK